jgi:hypothetical protein
MHAHPSFSESCSQQATDFDRIHSISQKVIITDKAHNDMSHLTKDPVALNSSLRSKA